MKKLQDYKVTLHQVGTDDIAFMALRAKTDKEAINKAHRCMGQGWYTVALEA